MGWAKAVEVCKDVDEVQVRSARGFERRRRAPARARVVGLCACHWIPQRQRGPELREGSLLRVPPDPQLMWKLRQELGDDFNRIFDDPKVRGSEIGY